VAASAQYLQIFPRQPQVRPLGNALFVIHLLSRSHGEAHRIVFDKGGHGSPHHSMTANATPITLIFLLRGS